MFITFKPINLQNATFGENHIRSASGASGAYESGHIQKNIMNGSPHTLKMPQFIKKIHKMNKHYLNLFSKYFFYIQKYLVTAFAVFQKYTTPRSSTPSGVKQWVKVSSGHLLLSCLLLT